MREPYVRKLGSHGGYKTFLVDGTYVRLHLDPDFTMGMNGFAKSYCPKSEIWIDDGIVKDERQNVIVHEVAEASLMSRGMGYHTAHAKANIPEGVLRRLNN